MALPVVVTSDPTGRISRVTDKVVERRARDSSERLLETIQFHAKGHFTESEWRVFENRLVHLWVTETLEDQSSLTQAGFDAEMLVWKLWGLRTIHENPTIDRRSRATQVKAPAALTTPAKLFKSPGLNAFLEDLGFPSEYYNWINQSVRKKTAQTQNLETYQVDFRAYTDRSWALLNVSSKDKKDRHYQGIVYGFIVDYALYRPKTTPGDAKFKSATYTYRRKLENLLAESFPTIPPRHFFLDGREIGALELEPQNSGSELLTSYVKSELEKYDEATFRRTGRLNKAQRSLRGAFHKAASIFPKVESQEKVKVVFTSLDQARCDPFFICFGGEFEQRTDGA